MSVWLAALALAGVLLVSAVQHRAAKTCTGYSIRISTSGQPQCIDRRQVEDLLTQQGKWQWKGKKLADLDLRKMEQTLKQHKWIRRAEIYVDNHQVIQVLVRQKQPIARVFTESGTSFYVDSACERLPLAGDQPARVPVFTGFPDHRQGRYDSVLLCQVKGLATYITEHPFWMAAVAQVNITADGEFELIPSVGSHIVEMGDGTDISEKFDRLFLFYKEVLVPRGFERYARIKVQFKQQVVAVRKERSERRTDSLRAAQFIEWLNQPGQAGLANGNATIANPSAASGPIAGTPNDRTPSSSQKVHPLKDPNPYETARTQVKPGER